MKRTILVVGLALMLLSTHDALAGGTQRLGKVRALRGAAAAVSLVLAAGAVVPAAHAQFHGVSPLDAARYQLDVRDHGEAYAKEQLAKNQAVTAAYMRGGLNAASYEQDRQAHGTAYADAQLPKHVAVGQAYAWGGPNAASFEQDRQTHGWPHAAAQLPVNNAASAAYWVGGPQAAGVVLQNHATQWRYFPAPIPGMAPVMIVPQGR